MKKLIFLITIQLALFTSLFPQTYGWKDISANLRAIAGDDANLIDISCTSDNECWIASLNRNQVYHTTDGGNTWEALEVGHVNRSIHMIDNLNGYAGDISVSRTTDGGKTWTFIGYMQYPPQDIECPPGGETCYACGLIASVYRISANTITKMNVDATANFFSLSFPESADKGWLCGSSTIRTYENNNWYIDYETFPYYDNYLSIDMVDTLNGWAVGAGGVIIHTSDGINWTKQVNPDENARRLDACDFINQSEGWITGALGVFLHTTDGGENWELVSEGIPSIYFYGMQFTSLSNGYACGSESTVLKYTSVSGVEDFNGNSLDVKMYPNPASVLCHFQSAVFISKPSRVGIYDLSGRKLLEKSLGMGSKAIAVDVSELQSGLYFCRIIVGNKSVTKKIIIQK